MIGAWVGGATFALGILRSVRLETRQNNASDRGAGRGNRGWRHDCAMAGSPVPAVPDFEAQGLLKGVPCNNAT